MGVEVVDCRLRTERGEGTQQQPQQQRQAAHGCATPPAAHACRAGHAHAGPLRLALVPPSRGGAAPRYETRHAPSAVWRAAARPGRPAAGVRVCARITHHLRCVRLGTAGWWCARALGPCIRPPATHAGTALCHHRVTVLRAKSGTRPRAPALRMCAMPCAQR